MGAREQAYQGPRFAQKALVMALLPRNTPLAQGLVSPLACLVQLNKLLALLPKEGRK